MRVAQSLLGVLFLGVLFTSGYALAARATVSLTASGPQPATVTVDWGDTVAFSNGDTVDRGVTSQRAELDSGIIPPGGTFEHRFAGRAGRYNFAQTGTRPTSFGVVVLTAKGKVTLKTSKQVMAYGSFITVSGRSTYGGTPVVVQFRPAGASADWIAVLSENAASDGTYSGRIRVPVGGRMRAVVAADQVSSEIQDLSVLPRIAASLRPNRARAGSRVVVNGRVVPAGAASSADLEEYNTDRKAWVRKSSKALSKAGKVTIVLKAVSGRTKYRLSLKRGALEPGFAPVVSNSMLVIGS